MTTNKIPKQSDLEAAILADFQSDPQKWALKVDDSYPTSQITATHIDNRTVIVSTRMTVGGTPLWSAKSGKLGFSKDFANRWYELAAVFANDRINDELRRSLDKEFAKLLVAFKLQTAD